MRKQKSYYSAYEKFTVWFDTHFLWWIIPSAFVIGIFVPIFLNRVKVKKAAREDIERSNRDGQRIFFSQLTTVEKQLLEQLMKLSEQDEKMSLTVMNRWLGIAQKDNDIQKSRRNTVLNAINEKYKAAYKQSQNLIEREKDVLDKRSFNYFISKKHLNLLKKRI